MSELDVYGIVLVISIIIVLIIIPRFHFYTPDGDISNYYEEKMDCNKSDIDLIESLYGLCIYDYCKVRWHYTFLLSLVASIFGLYLINCVNLRNIIILTLLFFIAIELPGRLESGHIKSTTANKATIIYGALSDRLGNNNKNHNNNNNNSYDSYDSYDSYSSNSLDYYS